MSKTDKLLNKLLSRPKTYKWTDLETLLGALGYEKREGSGSRVKFFNGNPKELISLHKPHPGNEMKEYSVSDVADTLEGMGYGKK